MKANDLFKRKIRRRQFLACLGAGAAGCALAGLPSATAVAPAELHEANFYTKLKDGRVRCALCPHGCVVNQGQRGFCRVRENREGTYYTLVYGRACTTRLDPIEKKPFFHVYPGTKAYSIATVGCNITCKFCQNYGISQASPEDFSVPYKSPAQVAAAAVQAKAKTIAYTYNEPTIFHEYMFDCAKAGKEREMESIMVSNGFITAGALKPLLSVLKAIKIDFKGFTQTFYGDICGGQLNAVKDTLKRLAQAGIWYEIVMLIIPTLNDGADEIKSMTAWIVKELGPNVPLHLSRYHPMYKMRNIPLTPLATLKRSRRIAMEQGCNFVYIGNVPGNEGQNTICPFCKSIVIERYWYTILKNNIVNGKCGKCHKPIPGVWA